MITDNSASSAVETPANGAQSTMATILNSAKIDADGTSLDVTLTVNGASVSITLTDFYKYDQASFVSTMLSERLVQQQKALSLINNLVNTDLELFKSV